jgi:CheY-like chemotaxis protein
VFFPEIDCESEDQCQTVKPPPRGTETILFVDDEAQLVNVGQRMLEGLGYVVETKTSSVEALETFRMHSDRYDVVITDMTMPGMTGETLAKELMELQPDTPIILCTGFSHKMDEEKAKSIGIKGFVMKPLVKAEIANAIRSVLDEQYG